MKRLTLLSALLLGAAIVLMGTAVVMAQEEKPAAKGKDKAKPATAPEAEADDADADADGTEAPAVEKATTRDDTTIRLEQLLSDKGLTKDNRKFLLDEAAAIAKFDESKALYIKYQDAVMKYMTIVDFDENLANLNMEWQMMQQQANTLQQQINNQMATAGRFRGMVNANLAPLRQQHAQLVAQANQMKAQFTAMQKQAPKPADRDKASSAVEESRKAYVDAIHELEKLVTPLLAKYHELGLDKSVTDALEQLRHKTTKNYKLGPSDELRAAAKVIKDLKVNTAGPAKTKAGTKKKAATKGAS